MRPLAIAISLFLAACATVKMGREFDVGALSQLETGKATKADVLALAGEPWMRTAMPDGTETWTYMSGETSASALNPSLLVPFWTHIDVEQRMRTAVLTFRGDLLERIDWTRPPK